MRRDVENYVRECDDCHRRKQGREYIEPLEVRQPTYSFEITSMDICGPYPLTPRKNKYLLTFIDHLTQYAEAIPIVDVSRNMCESICYPDCSQTRLRVDSSDGPGKVIYLSVF
jgi:hypothetical protein